MEVFDLVGSVGKSPSVGRTGERRENWMCKAAELWRHAENLPLQNILIHKFWG